MLTFTMLDQATITSVLEGMQVFDAIGVQNVAAGSFSGSGLLFWTGTVEGCGEGTFYAEGEFAGIDDPDGVNTFSVNNFTHRARGITADHRDPGWVRHRGPERRSQQDAGHHVHL